MTRMTGPDCAVMCNLINTHTHTHTLFLQRPQLPPWVKSVDLYNELHSRPEVIFLPQHVDVYCTTGLISSLNGAETEHRVLRCKALSHFFCSITAVTFPLCVPFRGFVT